MMHVPDRSRRRIVTAFGATTAVVGSLRRSLDSIVLPQRQRRRRLRPSPERQQREPWPPGNRCAQTALSILRTPSSSSLRKRASRWRRGKLLIRVMYCRRGSSSHRTSSTFRQRAVGTPSLGASPSTGPSSATTGPMPRLQPLTPSGGSAASTTALAGAAWNYQVKTWSTTRSLSPRRAR